MTSETDSVDPEDQRDCLSQHSSSRASSTDLFIKGVSSPRAESPCDSTSSRHTPRSKKTPAPTMAEIANYLEAFKQGWKREIVLRATQNPSKAGGARADIYYYAPSGKKLRSRVEIEDYLYRTGIKDLTLKNFTWIKEPLGVSEDYEQIRHASNKSVGGAVGPPRRKPSQGTPNSSRNTSPSSTPKSSASSSQLTPTPKASPVVTITSITKTPLVTKSPQTTKVLTAPPSPAASSSPSSSVAPATTVVPSGSTINPKMTYMYDVSAPKRKRGRGRPRKSAEELAPKRPRMKTTPVVPILMKKSPALASVGPAPPPPPLPPPPTTLPNPTGLHYIRPQPPPQVMSLGPQRPILITTTSRPRQIRKTKDPIVTTGRVTMLPPCPPKILTPMLIGGARQRTFHCTGNCPLGGGSVPCLQCLKCLCLFHPECTCMPPPTVQIIQAGAAKFLCPNCYWENKENVGSKKWVPPEPFEPLAHDPSSSSSSSDSEEEDGSSEEKFWVGDYVKVCVRPDTPPTPPSSPSPSHSLGPWRTDGSDSRQDVNSDTPQTGESGEVSRDMPSVSGAMPGGAALGGQLVQIQQQGAGPACFLLVQGGPGGELLSVPGGGVPMGMPKGMSPMILPRLPMQQQQQLQVAPPMMIQQQQFQPSSIPLNMPPQASIQQKPDRPKGKHYKQYYQAMSQWDNTFLGELSQRYLLLRHVFRFLSVRDLVVASQVCLLWRDLAFSTSLWETVRLRNVCVKDWKEFARFLEQRNTKNIDLRKMRLKKQDVKKMRLPSMQSRKELKPATKGKVQEGSTTFQPIFKSSDKPGTSKDQKTNSRTEGKNGKKTKADSEEASSSDSQRKGKTKTSAESSQDRKPEGISRSVVDEKNRNGHRKDKKEVQEEGTETEEGKERGLKRKRSIEAAQESEDLYMECTEEEDDREAGGDVDAEESPARKLEAEESDWLEIFTALSNVRCLRGVTLPSCPGRVLQLLLASCKHITSINAMDLRQSSGCVRFDPSYLMEAPNLVELRIGSPSGFSLTTNFNFIKLQKLKVLVMRGLAGDTWPYLGTSLTTLQVGPVRTFATSTWANLGNMTKLQALWLEEGGLMLDANIFDGLSRLTSLRRLCLFNFVVGPKLGPALKKLSRLERLFILPVGTEEASIKNQNGNMLVTLEMLRNVEELVWGVHASDVCVLGGTDCIQMCTTKSKVFSGMIENPESSLWSLPQLEKALKRHLPHSNVRIIKLDPTAASHLALATL